MAERCQHVDLDNNAICDCPHFIPKVNLTAAEISICNGCLHTIVWHRIPSLENTTSSGSNAFITSTSTGSTSTASSVDDILASFTSQAASVGSAKKAQMRGKKGGASEAEAHQEAVSGLKRSLGKGAVQDTSTVSPSTIISNKY